MFRIHAPSPVASTSAFPYGQPHEDPSTGTTGTDLMDVDEDQPFAAPSSTKVAIPGESIASMQDWMRGHGSYVENDYIVASVAGQVERVNKLVSVKPFRSKYRPEVGDLVIGRIIEVGPRRWRVEADGWVDAVLMLSSINLPGGVQRRKLESDELQMRTFFQEGDLLVAEVQSILGEGTISLHTRSLKYGKLRNGRLVKVPPTLVVRLKSHFHALPYGVHMIVGLNGYIWIQTPSALSGIDSTVQSSTQDDWQPEAAASMAIYSSTNDPIDPQLRARIDRTAVCIELLARNWITISLTHVQMAYEASLLLTTEDGLDVPLEVLDQHAEEIIAALAEA